MSKSAIYLIVNVINNKYYVGSAKNYVKRWNYHLNDLRKNIHKNSYLQHSWNKYGERNFIFSVIEIVEDKSKLIEREQWWINFSECCNPKKGYNIAPRAGNTLGVKYSIESRIRMSISRKGRVITQEWRNKIGLAHKGKTKDANRDFVTWPHDGGKKCRCEECKSKIRELNRIKVKKHRLRKRNKI